LLWVHAAAVHKPVRIIIDTDMSTDCDDVGALCMAHALADLNECEILAVVHDTGALHGTSALHVLACARTVTGTESGAP
jgi:hypothetical protein